MLFLPLTFLCCILLPTAARCGCDGAGSTGGGGRSAGGGGGGRSASGAVVVRRQPFFSAREGEPWPRGRKYNKPREEDASFFLRRWEETQGGDLNRERIHDRWLRSDRPNLAPVGRRLSSAYHERAVSSTSRDNISWSASSDKRT